MSQQWMRWPSEGATILVDCAKNNRAENSHLPIRKRERHMQQFKSQVSAQRFLTLHGAVYNTFYTQRHLASRKSMKLFREAAHQAWRDAVA